VDNILPSEMAFTLPTEGDTLETVRFAMRDWLGHDGPFLLGRDEGQQARARLERELLAQRTGEEPIAIDFADVKGMSVPFAHAFFVPLLSSRAISGYYGEHPIIVINAAPDVSETLEAVMRQTNLAVVALQNEPNAELLGGEPSLRETLHAAATMKEFSAQEIGKRLGLTAPAVNNRLKQLVQIGALVRTQLAPARGGREYRYKVPRPTAPLGS
jgi:hypothetical protein